MARRRVLCLLRALAVRIVVCGGSFHGYFCKSLAAALKAAASHSHIRLPCTGSVAVGVGIVAVLWLSLVVLLCPRATLCTFRPWTPQFLHSSSGLRPRWGAREAPASPLRQSRRPSSLTHSQTAHLWIEAHMDRMQNMDSLERHGSFKQWTMNAETAESMA